MCRMPRPLNCTHTQLFSVPTLSGENAYYRLFYAYYEVSFFVFSVGLDKRSFAVTSG